MNELLTLLANLRPEAIVVALHDVERLDPEMTLHDFLMLIYDRAVEREAADAD